MIESTVSSVSKTINTIMILLTDAKEILVVETEQLPVIATEFVIIKDIWNLGQIRCVIYEETSNLTYNKCVHSN